MPPLRVFVIIKFSIKTVLPNNGDQRIENTHIYKYTDTLSLSTIANFSVVINIIVGSKSMTYGINDFHIVSSGRPIIINSIYISFLLCV